MTDLPPTEESVRAAAGSWVSALRYVRFCDSTNRLAADWAMRGGPHAALVVADYQTAGRGRLDRVWLAPAGTSLLLSLVLRPRFVPRHRGLVPLAAGVALCRAARSLGVDASLKWPNDVLVGDKKLAGILMEVREHYMVLGVGVNVAQTTFPGELEDRAISLALAGVVTDRWDVLAKFIAEFAEVYDAIPQGLVDIYRSLCGTLGARVRVVSSGVSVEDVAEDIDEAGALVLAGGSVISAADVVHLRS